MRQGLQGRSRDKEWPSSPTYAPQQGLDVTGIKEISFFPYREWLGMFGHSSQGTGYEWREARSDRVTTVMEEVGTRHSDQRLGWSSRGWEKRPACEAGIHGAASWLGH